MKTLKISAPGSIMITGEHAVVYGHPAIVCAIEQRLTIRFEARADTLVTVHSALCAPQTIALQDLKIDGPLRYVYGALLHHRTDLSCGLDITITSDINPTLGLGSSAAVAIAMLGGLMHWTGKAIDLALLHRNALALVRSIQGRGSGADLAASLYGGMVCYQLPPGLLGNCEIVPHGSHARIEPLPNPPEMSLRYCGYKTPTAAVLAMIAERMASNESHYHALYDRMGALASQTITAAKTKDWLDFNRNINAYQSLMAELGVCDETLDGLIEHARQAPGVTSAKISGSGLGDCILAFGPCPPRHQRAVLATQGFRIDDQASKSEG